jgi:hypothetical protein
MGRVLSSPINKKGKKNRGKNKKGTIRNPMILCWLGIMLFKNGYSVNVTRPSFFITDSLPFYREFIFIFNTVCFIIHLVV